MHNNKVKEKVIWEDRISIGNESSTNSQMQQQMMFCYKCNNVIPNDSLFCPYCQTNLYAVCPRCGEIYSSQYPACRKCGTNREEYLQRQRELEEIGRKKRIELEKIELEKKKAYYAKNAEIIKTEEYKSAYTLFVDAFKDGDKKRNKFLWIASIVQLSPIFYSLGMMIWTDETNKYGNLFILSTLISLLLVTISSLSQDYYIKKIFFKYISKRLKGNNYYKDVITPEFINEVYNIRDCEFADYFPDYYTISYRRKNKMPINVSCHRFLLP